MVIPAVLVATGLVALVACTTGGADPGREEVPRRPELVAGDGNHPSDLGYARWAELMWSRVEPRATRC